jgi:hypothetical protein
LRPASKAWRKRAASVSRRAFRRMRPERSREAMAVQDFEGTRGCCLGRQSHGRRSVAMKIVAAYTVPQTGPATRAAVDRFLAAPRLMRLGVTEPDGTPLVHPVWYTWEQDQFLLHLPAKSPKRMAIEAQPTVYFTVDVKGPGIFGVRGKARAAIDPDRERLRKILQDQWTGTSGRPTANRAAFCWAWSRQANSFWRSSALAIWRPGDYRRTGMCALTSPVA